ncbi:hypothetical protein ENBRE01_2414 [Enteropsectra breve]|nr:hypothetical protein ENBRE01_2414 [Enteropsectra breve]
MRYKLGSEQEICIHTRKKEVSSKIISFFNLFNEGTPVYKNIVKFVGWAPKSRIEDLDVIFCSLLRLLPQIKELNLYNTPKSTYNLCHKGKSTYFDHLLLSLLADNRETLNGLNGFVVFGFNSPDVNTFAHLKQYKFKTLGMRGVFSRADLAYMWLAFKEEGTTDGKCYNNQALDDDSEHVNGVATCEYNNLRNSVTHLVGSEEIIREALRYRLVENLVAGNVALHRYNDHYKLYEHELAIMEEYNNFKKNCKNARHDPLPLVTLRVDPTPDLMEDYNLYIREKNKGLPATISLCETLQKKGTLTYSVSNLVILEVNPYVRTNEFADALRSIVEINDTIEVTIDKYDIDNIYYTVWLNSLKRKDLNIVLNVPITENAKEQPKVLTSIASCVYRIFKKYFDDTNKLTLTVLFDTPKIFESVEADLKKQFEKLLLDEICDRLSYFERNNFKELSVTEKKKMLSALRFERSTNNAEYLIK